MLRWLATCAVTIGCLATAGHGDVVNEDFKLLAADGAAEDRFGSSVSIDGDTGLTVASTGSLISGSNSTVSNSGTAVVIPTFAEYVSWLLGATMAAYAAWRLR